MAIAQRIEDSLREKICPNCARYTSDHRCSLPKDRQCGIFRNLPEMIRIVRDVHSGAVDPYALEVRGRICAACPHEDGHGSCPMREGVDCALDAYLPMIIDEIETQFAAHKNSPPRPIV